MYRFFEILPATLAWTTLIGLIFLSWLLPIWVSIFIVLYDLYWFLRTIYLFLHLRFSFKLLRENIKIDWLKRLEAEKKNWYDIHHLVIFPMYHESYELVRASLVSLFETNFPKDRLIVVLATEERGGEADKETAAKIEREFSGKFKKLLVTFHPANVADELPGKGSNETWAAKEVIRKVIDVFGLKYDNVLVSVFDIDTRPGKDYFSILTYQFLTVPKSDRSSFQPIPLFINNIYNVPVFARLIAFVSTFWQLMQQARPQQLVTFSSHSMPLRPLIEVGFWQRDVVSEDSRIFFQLFNHYKGDWRVHPMHYPIYMDAVSGNTFGEAIVNLYKQQRRWGWGVENIPYVFTSFIKDKMMPFRKKLFWLFNLFAGFYSWSTNSFIIFLFGFLPVLLGSGEFQRSVLSYNLPKVTGILMNLSVFGIITSAFLSIFFLAPKLRGLGPHYYILYFLQWFMIPIVFFLFQSIPALEAQTRLLLGGRFRLGFWKTPKNKEEHEGIHY